jgi:hypothetical protein
MGLRTSQKISGHSKDSCADFNDTRRVSQQEKMILKESNMRTTQHIAATIPSRLALLPSARSWTSALIKLSAICLFSVIIGTRAYAVPNNATCSNSTLEGDYASTVGGQLFHADGSVETRQGLVMTHFDGRGNFTQTDYVLNTSNGTTAPTPGPIDPQTGFQNHESGTYHVNSDCTGNLEIHFAPPPVPGAIGAVLKLFLVIGSQGNALRMVVISVAPPSTAPNDITGFTLHSEGSKLGEQQENK